MAENKREKIFVLHNGCTRRAIDASRLVQYFKLNNCDVVENPQKADYLLFVTCAFNDSKEEDSFKLMDKLNNYTGELIIAGCLPEIAPGRFKREFNGKFVATKNLDAVDHIFKHFKVRFSDVSDGHHYHFSLFLAKFMLKRKFLRCLHDNPPFKNIKYEFNLVLSQLKRLIRSKTRTSTLRISYGCLGNCAYCGIQKAIGKLKSKPLDVCLKEYRELLGEGYRNFELIADDLGAYGLDINSSFSDLIERMSGVDKGLDVSWYLMDLDPKWAIRYKYELLKRIKEGKITRILCPIQSGSSRILKLMNRYSKSEDIIDTLLEFKGANPDLILETFVIVGFPSESEEEFFMTIDTIKKIKFNELQLHPYCDRETSASYKFDRKIDDTIIKRRLSIALDVLKKEGLTCQLV